jgi:hypothetical protein
LSVNGLNTLASIPVFLYPFPRKFKNLLFIITFDFRSGKPPHTVCTFDLQQKRNIINNFGLIRDPFELLQTRVLRVFEAKKK